MRNKYYLSTMAICLVAVIIICMCTDGYGQRKPQLRFENLDSSLILIDNNNDHVLTITNLGAKDWRGYKFRISDTVGGYVMMLEEIKWLQKENKKLKTWLDKCVESEDRKDRLLTECSDIMKQFIKPKTEQ